MREHSTLLPVLLGLVLAGTGCPDDASDDDSAADDDVADDDAADDDAADDDTSTGEGVSISGTVLDFATFSPPAMASSLTVSVADPTPALTGNPPAILGTVNANGDGTFIVSGLHMEGVALGALLIVDDAGDDYEPTATGVPSSCYLGLPDGGVCSDRTAFAIDSTVHMGMVAGTGAAGWTGTSLVEVGAFIGFVQDSAGAPIGDAVVTGPDGISTFYADADFFTGNAAAGFVGSGGPNAATDASAQALFIIPEAPIGSYSAEASGYTFDSLTSGSQPNVLLVVAIGAK